MKGTLAVGTKTAVQEEVKSRSPLPQRRPSSHRVCARQRLQRSPGEAVCTQQTTTIHKQHANLDYSHHTPVSNQVACNTRQKAAPRSLFPKP
eukprot:7590434-Pyramimonas_sp.AAC.1